MRFRPQDPPREFEVGYGETIVMRDCGRVELDADEQVTFTTESGAEYDVARKSWGFYATPSLNGRLTGFGLRTLSSDSPVFDPFAYHRGTIWPFDSWLGWAGLRAAGAVEAAERVRTGVLRALAEDGRYPELYAVTGAGVQRVPIANRVQAWTVGAAWALEHEWDGRAHVVA